ncbi:MAG: AmmeMemoRadiSam system protein A [Desulfamplus sp.]|nr:AmmeMemoRadiSam system protein A [Desulfamplus sp.]
MDNRVNLQGEEDVLSEDQGQILVRLARAVIGERLGMESHLIEKKILLEKVGQPEFSEKTGTFVTIHLNKKLKGCIGSLESSESIAEGVVKNAVNAAFHDPRFTPMTVDELHGADIEVSVLSKPVPLVYKESDEILSGLKQDIHGVIIKKGRLQATFLPQVWHQLPEKKMFLEHLCKKAGLPAREWQKGTLEIFTYTVQSFEDL